MWQNLRFRLSCPFQASGAIENASACGVRAAKLPFFLILVPKVTLGTLLGSSGFIDGVAVMWPGE